QGRDSGPIMSDLQAAIIAFNKGRRSTDRVMIASSLEARLSKNRYRKYIVPQGQATSELSDIGVFSVDRITRTEGRIRYKFYVGGPGPGPRMAPSSIGKGGLKQPPDPPGDISLSSSRRNPNPFGNSPSAKVWEISSSRALPPPGPGPKKGYGAMSPRWDDP